MLLPVSPAWPLLANAARTLAQQQQLFAPAAVPLQQAFSSSNHENQQGLGILEIREYTLHPAGSKAFMQLAAENAQLRGQLLPFLG